MPDTSPVPQMPRGWPPPTTVQRGAPSAPKATAVTAPSRARMPHEISAPSKAGPAAVEVVTRSPSRARTISPFVPMSMDSVVFFSVSRPSETIMPMVSAPT